MLNIIRSQYNILITLISLILVNFNSIGLSQVLPLTGEEVRNICSPIINAKITNTVGINSESSSYEFAKSVFETLKKNNKFGISANGGQEEHSFLKNIADIGTNLLTGGTSSIANISISQESMNNLERIFASEENFKQAKQSYSLNSSYINNDFSHGYNDCIRALKHSEYNMVTPFVSAVPLYAESNTVNKLKNIALNLYIGSPQNDVRMKKIKSISDNWECKEGDTLVTSGFSLSTMSNHQFSCKVKDESQVLFSTHLNERTLPFELIISDIDMLTSWATNKLNIPIRTPMPFQQTKMVDAAKEVNDTGISDINIGDTIEFNYIAGEKWTISSPRAAGYPYVDANGYSSIHKLPDNNTVLLLNSAPRGSLLGQIGNGPLFYLGNHAKIKAPSSGNLKLMMNDSPNNQHPIGYTDNDGTIMVNITTLVP